ncbi:putative type IX secretion system sortase PorU2 [Hymenobacter pini]|uniref:putative type IX secretion system sortase PorU2 n=1 Tax=Hymenobacter pini TaxID=2880879 RepID=UPI001CF38923|nr:C25 family cysteine peptidase [Hymenobacter pini]MCA8829475.1 C25 family cysteine peptidase [Hymenobacter pini]
MTQAYQKLWLLVLLVVLSISAARAQSGPYGNEWIVPGQQYYKIKVARDGLYRLDYQYLQRAGISGVNPQRLQLWRRGKEVAIHVGGNTTALDNSTFIEFFGQRNDAALDKGMYLTPADQAQPYYSLFTDTASYFLTWSSAAGKRMVQSNPAATGAPHTSRIRKPLQVQSFRYNVINDETNTYQPWAERGEGFFSDVFAGSDASFPIDSVWRMTTTAQSMRADIQVVGATQGMHSTQVSVALPSGGSRVLGTLNFANFDYARGSYALLSTDRAANGRVTILVKQLLGTTSNQRLGDRARVAYVRVTYPETIYWRPRLTQQLFSSDSTLASPAYYQLDSIPATVRGYDVSDPYDVQRVEGRPGQIATQRSFVFSTANGRTRTLLLADADRALVPVDARRVIFRQVSPAAHNFIIVTSRVLMKAAASSGVTTPNAVRAYSDYRASALGGKWDTLVITSEQLYDQFHYGERSALAVRQFAQWMLAGSSRPKSLLLLGKGIGVSEATGCNKVVGGAAYYRQYPLLYGDCSGANPVLNLVPASTRGISDIFFTANWQAGDYRPQMITGRIAAQTPQQVLSYLNKLKEHEALGYEPWRKNVIHIVGSDKTKPWEDPLFTGYLNTYARFVQSPPFAGQVIKLYRRETFPGTLPSEAPLNLAPDFNAGVGFISYFGHGGPNNLEFTIPDIRQATTGFVNKSKYPVWYVSGCSAGNSFTAAGSFGGENYLLAEDKGIIGFLADSDLGFDPDLHELHTEISKLLFADNDWYGKPIAEVQREAVRRLGVGLSPVDALQARKIASLMNTIWQGDPVLKLFSPLQPDFQTADARLQISPAVVPATAGTRFELKLGVSNPGRVTTGPLAIRVTRTFGSTTLTTNFTVPQARQDTTYTLSLTNPATGSVAGANIFQVDLDPDNLIAESDETNNRATLNYSFLTGGVTTLSPPEFAIVGSRAVRLVAQSNVPTITARDYDLEADTVQTFNSPVLQRTKVNAVMVPEWQPTLPTSVSQDSVVWYWRVRLNAPQGDESADWATSSFRIINGRTQGGWSQSHHGQFRRDERTGAEVAVPGGQWTYNAGAQEATITSTRIGPARQWETLYHTIRTSSTGSYTLRLLGIDSLGATTVLNPDVANRALPLNGISAKQYPYLQLQAVLREATPGVTPQLEQWLVTYQGVPEGVVRPSVTPLTAAALTQQAQQTGSITVPVTFQNVADFDFTAPLAGYIVLRSGTAGVLPRERYYPLAGAALTAHSQRTYEVKLDVRGLYGTLSGQVVLNPRRQPEQFYFNNELSLPPFQVSNQDTPPVLDVAFDGRHLLNGEIVSPQPIISVQLRDLDKLRPIQNRSNFILSLTPPKSTSSITVDLNAAGIEFVADSAKGTATLTYRPGNTTPLLPGVYTLEVQGKDGAGNLAGSEPYRITFEVIAESTITNVFPYPNPVTSKTKFVFTLTGATLPRNMKIQIVSLTGRVVKEIMMADLGPLRIGNNITEYAWDGTDDYGDRLANGTYLYRVVLDDPDNQFKQRATGGDRAFKKDWGKLVLLR